ncbi:hypothetical protein [Streptomyces lydicus]|uniref:hypothetical protein n=1 Tax=Streptomyces lydicus TaxID=47763 RepID=UPI00287058F5|nr:hypothetical protein [Streptomyces lydicus]
MSIVCSITALLIRPSGRGVLWETAVLVLGVIFYMASLTIAVVGATQAAGGMAARRSPMCGSTVLAPP